ncbi:Inner membrane protein YbjJ [Chryseobacterium sp. MOF25P]|uniref:MFS transporter n=1 Tax=unclassified Chryseobacterium TaxID=2593645 RepID=UPI000804967A|nr:MULTISPECIES: MFS transporter [unclassified Chryseobacterium]OBW39380.1 Inner membrane protein YbjJ [Chryseobacterium sp. MOF25P]OBW43864.1 Inner membrane protein YbjJ [Chryseobacterium sp. BGARF1]
MAQQKLPRVRLSIFYFYFIMGLIFASWASRIPDIKSSLNLNDGQLGQVLFAMPLGQLLMMVVSGYLVNKFGSRIILITAMTLYAIALTFIPQANSFNLLFLVLFFFGITSNMANIAVNTQAVSLEALYKRNIMSSFHGLWSLGGLTGGILGAVFAETKFSIFTHLVIILILGVIGIIIFSRGLLAQDIKENSDAKTSKKAFKLDSAIIILGLIGFGSMFCEGTMFDWSSVYFSTIIKPDETFVRLGYIASMGAMTFGRFVADRFVNRYQASVVLRFCGILITSGLLLATVAPGLIISTFGFLLIGLGVSSIVPICYSAAGRLKTMSASIAITAVSSISFLGFMIGPPLIGLLSEITDLRIALLAASSFGILIIVLSYQYKSIKF